MKTAPGRSPGPCACCGARLRAHSTLLRVLIEGVKACPAESYAVSTARRTRSAPSASPSPSPACVLASWASLDSDAFGAEGEDGRLLAEFEDAAEWLGIQAADLRERLVDFELTPCGDDD